MSPPNNESTEAYRRPARAGTSDQSSDTPPLVSSPVKVGYGRKVVASAPHAVAWSKPDFTLNEVRAAVPAHLFKRDTARSFRYVFADFAMMFALWALATQIDHVLPKWATYIAWPAYWIAQGVVCTGIWVIAHECGHQAFSDKAWINNSVGYVLHSFLLVPYYSWKFSHSKHHKANAHMTKDQVFVPAKRSKYAEKLGEKKEPAAPHHDEPIWADAPIADLLNIVAMLTVGWPMYLINNASGQRFDTWTSHFRPTAPIFEPKQWFQVVLSDIGMAIMIGLLCLSGYIWGAAAVFKFYVIPYLNVNAWLVLITFLQHTDPQVPHYSENEWNYLLGAISTVDRDFGVLNHFHHHISDSHVVHHIFPTMPHYNAVEATAYVKEFLGKYYLYDPTPFYKAVWNSYTTCKFVEDEGDVKWFKH
ncbi:fatty acid desaturase-domain-containing protein [Powellomyces hirtus]|nr:fatty acid desaturase-domain-containing protein [Powellomyces hirtus]